MNHSMAIPSRNKRKARSSPELETQPPESKTQPPSPNADPNIPSSSSSVADNFSSPSTKPLVFPPGYKFTPSDEELILYYLKPFLEGNRYSLLNVPIHHVNIYESNPQQLTAKFKKGNEKEWFFISERTKKGKGCKQKNRIVNGGYWKTTGSPKKIRAGFGLVGYKNSLDYFVGKQPNGVKGDWIMQECYFESSSHNNDKVDHALCKIYLAPKAAKEKKKEEKEKLKAEECIPTIDVEQSLIVEYLQPHQPQFLLSPLDSYQPDQPQSCLLPLVSHQSLADLPLQPSAQHQPCPSNLGDFSETFSFQQLQQQPLNLDDYNDFFTNFTKPYSIDG